MTSSTDFQTWANLKPDTPFNRIFPDGRVPIASIVPIIPRDENGPPSYLADPAHLTERQINSLAEMLQQQWDECETIEQAIEYIKGGLPLRKDWFEGISSTDPLLLMDFADFIDGDECREPYDDEDDYEG